MLNSWGSVDRGRCVSHLIISIRRVPTGRHHFGKITSSLISKQSKQSKQSKHIESRPKTTIGTSSIDRIPLFKPRLKSLLISSFYLIPQEERELCQVALERCQFGGSRAPSIPIARRDKSRAQRKNSTKMP